MAVEDGGTILAFNHDEIVHLELVHESDRLGGQQDLPVSLPLLLPPQPHPSGVSSGSSMKSLKNGATC